MAHPKFNPNITKEELDKPKYQSMVDEFRRHIRFHYVIKITYPNPHDLFEHLIIVLRELYNVPKKDFQKVGSNFMIDKYSYKIMNYQQDKALEFEAIAKGQLYNVKYVIRKSLWGYRVHYYDYSKTQETLWGLKANLTKHYYKKGVKRNTHLLKKQLQLCKIEKGLSS